MRTVTIEISSVEDSMRRFKRAWTTGESQGEFISFDSPETLFKQLTTKRWELVRVLQQDGAMSIRGLARRLKRDVKNVHADVMALIEIGLIEKEERKICVPFDEIKTEFVMRRAA
jgi:Predicted transcriptional regulator